MKFKTTKKEMLESAIVIPAGYCELQSLLKFKNPVAYTMGVYGWNCDIYDIGYNCYISTGYRPFGNAVVDYEAMEEAEQKALEILRSEASYEYKIAMLDILIDGLRIQRKIV